jgi:hypothetical protein
MDIQIIKLQIAKAAIAVNMSEKDADKWLEWILRPDINSEVKSEENEYKSDEELAHMVSYPFSENGYGKASIVWDKALFVVRYLKYDYFKSLTFEQACVIARFFGISKNKLKTAMESNDKLDISQKKPFLTWCFLNQNMHYRYPHIKRLVNETAVALGIVTRNINDSK